MSDLETFRKETVAWLEANAPKSLFGTRRGGFDGYWGGKKAKDTPKVWLEWFDIMLAKGWTAPKWPTQFGGGGLSNEEATILAEELHRLKLPPPLVGVGLSMIGPTLLDYGTPEQQAEHIPPIVRGEIRWAQGYSEPGAGSDLASLSTPAVPDGDDYVINGQKVWTTFADRSDWIFVLVRTSSTGKKQHGITFILVDMDTPGLSVKPIALISGRSPFCETFFDDMRVPARNVVGEVDQGWTVAKALLGYERNMIGDAMGSELLTAEQRLLDRARRAYDAPSGPLPAAARDELAQWAMDERCFRLTNARIGESVEAGHAPGPESSTLKVYGSELKQRRWELAMSIAGPDGLGWEGPGFDDVDVETTRQWLRSRANTIEGGTSEIQLNIIAKRVLGLGASR